MSMDPGEPHLWKRVQRLIDCVEEGEASYWSFDSGSNESVLVPGLPENRDPDQLTAPEARLLFFYWLDSKCGEIADEEVRQDLEDCTDLFKTRSL